MLRPYGADRFPVGLQTAEAVNPQSKTELEGSVDV
jgi:hypothetical protein